MVLKLYKVQFVEANNVNLEILNPKRNRNSNNFHKRKVKTNKLKGLIKLDTTKAQRTYELNLPKTKSHEQHKEGAQSP